MDGKFNFEQTEEQIQNEVGISRLIFSTLALSGVFSVGLLLSFDWQDPIESISFILMVGGGFLSLLCLLAACLAAISEDITKKMNSDRQNMAVLCELLIKISQKDARD